MSIEDDIDNLIDKLDFDAIKSWCKTYDIPCYPESWVDDDYSDNIDSLKTQIKNCMLEAMETYRSDHRCR